MKAPNNAQRNIAIARDIFKHYPLATVLVEDPVAPMPTVGHIPLYFDESENTFYGHLSGGNPIVRLSKDRPVRAMLIFHGEQGYVSPSWSSHIKVPTWDYCAVHVHGQARIIDNPTEKLAQIQRQVSWLETSWTMDAMDQKTIEQKLGAIEVVGISAEQLQCRFKMSEAKSIETREVLKTRFASTGNSAMVSRYRWFD